MALAPFVVALVFVAGRFTSAWARGTIVLGPLAALLALTLGTVLSADLRVVLDMISPGQTFTGRTELWDFAVTRLDGHRLLGFGPEGFWGSSGVRLAEAAEDATGLANGMMHGHNSYLDVAVAMGLPGLVLSLIVLVWLPFRDWMNAVPAPANARMAQLFARIWLFCLYGACLESFFFRRADPVWFALLLAVFGLRLIATWRVEDRAPA
jgi:O-antigen ligase